MCVLDFGFFVEIFVFSIDAFVSIVLCLSILHFAVRFQFLKFKRP